jgi:hypothetical protein
MRDNDVKLLKLLGVPRTCELATLQMLADGIKKKGSVREQFSLSSMGEDRD